MDADRRAEALAAELERRSGRAPDGIWVAPGRVNLIGEHTDYNEGFVLPIAIDRDVVAAVARRDDDELHCWSRDEGEAAAVRLADLAPGAVQGWSGYLWGVVWALREKGVPVSGLDVVLDADVSSGGGLSSSAAIECSIGMAVLDLAGGPDATGIDRMTLALACQRAENDMVGAPTGVMDQAASLLGEPDHAVFLDCRSLAVEQIALGLADAGLEFLLVDTRVKHEHAEGGYGDRRRSCEEAARRLGVPALRDVSIEQLERAEDLLGDVDYRRARHVVTEDARVLEVVGMLRDGRVADIGPVLDASHASMRDDFEISVPELDTAVEAARAAGALGARMTGGGFGGSAVALVRAGAAGEVRSAVTAAFATRAFTTPELLSVSAAAGARRLQ